MWVTSIDTIEIGMLTFVLGDERDRPVPLRPHEVVPRCLGVDGHSWSGRSR